MKVSPPQSDFNSLSISERLWRRAYEDLKEKDPKSVYALERELSLTSETFHDSHQISAAITQRLKERDASRLIIEVGGKSIHVREQAEKVIKFIIWSTDFVSAAVASEPHAALAWAGLSMLLPVSTFLVYK